MSVSFGPTIVGTVLKEVPPGTIFMMEIDGASMLCLRGNMGPGNDIIGVLATKGGSEDGPGWFAGDYFLDSVVYPLTNVEFDFSGGAFGLPIPTKLANGAITIDQDHQQWLHVSGARGAMFINITTGEVGRPTNRTHFGRWSLVWHKPGAKEPVVIASLTPSNAP